MKVLLYPKHLLTALIPLCLIIPQLSLAQDAPSVVINEIQSSNSATIVDEDGDYSDWIELYNAGNTPVNLEGFGLSDNNSEPYKWIFPRYTLDAGDYLLVFASGKDRSVVTDILNPTPISYLHTNFKISASGETLLLTDAAGTTLDEIDAGEIKEDYSFGRESDGDADWVFFDEPTPGEGNETSGYLEFDGAVEFSLQSGLYQGTITLELSFDSPTAQIRYTTDGSYPNETSELYQSPLTLEITTVVKARAYETGYFPGEIVTSSFIINEDSTLPVVSLSTDPDNFFDDEIGIYVVGNGAAYGGYPDNPSKTKANYYADWERPIHVELFEPDGSSGFSIDAGVKLFGKTTRTLPQKSMAFYIREEYGLNELDYQLFPDMDMTEFKHFVLRNGGSDNPVNEGGVHFRDGLVSELVKDIDIDNQEYRPCVVYLNGQYWGLYNIREKLNEDYIAYHHGVDPNQVDIMDDYHASFLRSPGDNFYGYVLEGSEDHYVAMINYLLENDLGSDDAADYVRTQMNVDNYLSYMAVNIYIANHDGPGHNSKYWRPQDEDGTYRWMMYDVDHSFGMRVFIPDYHYEPEAYKDNTIDYYREPNGPSWPNPPESTFIFRKMMENTAIRNDFINILADYMNTIFAEEVVTAKILEVSSAIEHEMQDHFARWGGSMSQWQANVEVVKNFPMYRNQYLTDIVLSEYDIAGTADIDLVVSPAGTGMIRVNSVVPEIYPWEGTYYKGVPIEVSAIPAPGYRFSGWQNSDSISDTMSLDLDSDITITAIFEPDEDESNTVVINEINYNSSPDVTPGDWIELYNVQNVPVDISGWVFKDEDDMHEFIIPANTTIGSDDFLVLARNAAQFHEVFPDVANYVGDFEFGISGGGELLRLYDTNGAIVDSLTFDNNPPWPETPDGEGQTLALINPALDNNNPTNWKASLMNGSPGISNDLYAVEVAIEAAPEAFSLGQNFPNPFNPSTTIPFYLPENARVKIDVYSVLGQRVATLKDGVMTPGHHSVVFTADDLSAGIYFYTIQTDAFAETKNMLYIK